MYARYTYVSTRTCGGRRLQQYSAGFVVKGKSVRERSVSGKYTSFGHGPVPLIDFGRAVVTSDGAWKVGGGAPRRSTGLGTDSRRGRRLR